MHIKLINVKNRFFYYKHKLALCFFIQLIKQDRYLLQKQVLKTDISNFAFLLSSLVV